MRAETTSRVPKHTPPHLNQNIIDETVNNMMTHGISGPEIDRRLGDCKSPASGDGSPSESLI